MSKIKVGLAQIEYFPSCFSGSIDLLCEPCGDDTTSISEFSFPGSQKLKSTLRNNYISWIKLKIVTIINKAISMNVDLIVFPEYSIPPEILIDIYSLANKNKITIVAGTHIVTDRDIKVPPRYPDRKGNIKFALCPIIDASGVKYHTFKTHRAAVEIGNLKLPEQVIPDTFDMIDYKMQVKICIDALITENSENSFSDRDILVIPSWSNNTEPFQAISTLSKYNNVPTIYANCAQKGGSYISGAFPKNCKHWFVNGLLTRPIPPNTECLLTANINISSPSQTFGSVVIDEPISVDSVTSIYYSKNEAHKSMVRFIDTESKDYDALMKSESYASCDAITSQKIKYLSIQKSNGLYEESDAKEVLSYIQIPNVMLKNFKIHQSKYAFENIAANISHSSLEPRIFENFEILSKLLKTTQNPNCETEAIEVTQLFAGRDSEVAALGEFAYGKEKVLFLHGLRGMGKTKLINCITSKVLPSSSPWDVRVITFEIGIGFELLCDELSYLLNTQYIDRSRYSPKDLAYKMFEYINSGPSTILIFDDVHNCTDKNGFISNLSMKEFLVEFISLTLSTTKIKLLLSSCRKLPELTNLDVCSLDISRLSDKDIRFVINYCYQKLTGKTDSLDISDEIINIIYGNPLAAILVSQLLNRDVLQEYVTNSDSFHRFQERLITNLLGEVMLSSEEVSLLGILSVSKTSVSFSFIEKNYGYLYHCLDSLANRFLLECIGESISMHPLFKEYYYDKLDLKNRISIHKKYAAFYEDLFNNNSKPDTLSNMIFHFAGSLQRDKLTYYKFKYVEEMKPTADQLYNNKQYEDAVSYYQIIYDNIGETRADILIRMAQCYVYCGNLKKAQYFFDAAVKTNPENANLWAKYSCALSGKRENAKFANEIANRGEEVYKRSGYIYGWEYAKIKYAQAKARQYINIDNAITLYNEACELDPTNVFYLCSFARVLFRNGYRESAIKFYTKAKVIDPKHNMVIRLTELFERESITTTDSVDEGTDFLPLINDVDIEA